MGSKALKFLLNIYPPYWATGVVVKKVSSRFQRDNCPNEDEILQPQLCGSPFWRLTLCDDGSFLHADAHADPGEGLHSLG